MALASEQHKNHLYFGDNLTVLRKYVKDETVDLVYLDPPFNSNRNYSVIFNKHGEVDAAAQIEAFEDTWHWTPETETQYTEFVTTAPGAVADALTAFRTMLGENDAMSYLVNMAPRLVELHRVLKPTGSLYLHCDPTMSHYLKVLLDGIFDARNFRSEIIWQRYGAHSNSKGFGAIHDVILFYAKTQSAKFEKQYEAHNPEYVAQRYRHADPDGRLFREQTLVNPSVRPNLQYPYTALNGETYPHPANGWKYSPERMRELDEQGRLLYPTKQGGLLRLKNYLDEMNGMPVQDLWVDVGYIGSTSPERLGYPTQKPVALLERILRASSDPGDVVLDPFCGCGTTIDAAQKLGRRWIGIDITYISVDLIIKRLQHTYGNDITKTFETTGIPRDYAAAQAMFTKDAFEFERWAVSLVSAQPNAKQVGDKGIDGVGRFILGKGEVGKVLVSVKGGKTLNPSMVRDLAGTVKTQGAELGILITLAPATKGVTDAINHGGVWRHPANGEEFPVLQHVTIKDLMQGKRPKLPSMYKPYIEAKKQKVTAEMDGLW